MYRTLRRTITTLVIAVATILAVATPAWAGAPTDFVKKNAQDVTKLLRQKESKKRQKEFSTKLNEVVDFRELAARALGEHWKKRTPEEQQQFLDLLQQLLEANYRKKLEGKTMGEDYQIEYLDEKTRDNLAIVKTKVTWKDGAKPASYKLIKKDDGWVVYDIIIDDISLVETYRDAYTEIIEKEGWDSLIKRMKDKADKLAQK